MSAAAPVPSQQRMHAVDEDLTALVLDYVSNRLAMRETPLDHPGEKAEVDAILDGLITREGIDPRRVMEIYTEHLSKTVLSADSPRFLAFIPAAPTKAALLFDMLVSGASIQGISALEAAGAIAAENQVLRLHRRPRGPARQRRRGVRLRRLGRQPLGARRSPATSRASPVERDGCGRGDLDAHRGQRPGALVDQERAVDPGRGGAGRPAPTTTS